MGKYALLVGISRFKDSKLGGLKAPSSDVETLAAILEDPERGAFDSVVTSLDEDIDTIRRKVADLLEDRSPRDTALLYYSGHGILAASGQLYLATENTIAERPRLCSLAALEVRDMLRESRASRLIVILDCCHSGGFVEPSKGSAVPVTQQTFSSGDGAEGEYVLMSCNAMQVSLDSIDTSLSRFTSWVVDGLRGDAAPENPIITLDDLYEYVCRRARAAGTKMTPQRLVHRNCGILELARNPVCRLSELSPQLMEKLHDSDWKSRLAAVAVLEALSHDDRLRPLIRNAAAGRLAGERDTDVAIALERLIARIRDSTQVSTVSLRSQTPNRASMESTDVPEDQPGGGKKVLAPPARQPIAAKKTGDLNTHIENSRKTRSFFSAGMTVMMILASAATGFLVLPTLLKMVTAGWGPGQAGSPISLVSGLTGKCLEEPGTHNHDPVEQNPCNSDAGQRWLLPNQGYSEIVNQSSGLCIDIPWGSAADQTPLQVYTCQDSINQSWMHEDAGQLVSLGTKKCIGVPVGLGNDPVVREVECTQDDSTRWLFEAATRATSTQ